MDDAVTHAAHIHPRDGGDARLDVSGNMLSGFANDRQVTDHRIDRLLVIGKGLKGRSSRIALDLLDGGEDIVDAILPAFMRHAQPPDGSVPGGVRSGRLA